MNKQNFTLTKVLITVFLITVVLFFFLDYTDEKNEFGKKIKQKNSEPC